MFNLKLVNWTRQEDSRNKYVDSECDVFNEKQVTRLFAHIFGWRGEVCNERGPALTERKTHGKTKHSTTFFSKFTGKSRLHCYVKNTFSLQQLQTKIIREHLCEL